MKITVVSPSNRKDGLEVVNKSLQKQTFQNFEWLICADYTPSFYSVDSMTTLYPEPRKKRGDFYNLNKAWNLLFNKAEGELIVSIVDYTEFEPDTLQKLWDHYVNNPVTCVSGIGVRYKDGKPSWVDPRSIGKDKHIIHPIDMEFRLASVPRRAIQAVGGIDEEYDKVAANSEKEICVRMATLGYFFLIDESIIYKFYDYGGKSEIWQKKWKKAQEMLNTHLNEIAGNKRLQLNYVNR